MSQATSNNLYLVWAYNVAFGAQVTVHSCSPLHSSLPILTAQLSPQTAWELPLQFMCLAKS